MVTLSRLRRASARLSGFAASTTIAGLVSLLTTPFVITFAGASAWVVVAVGQTVGGAAAVVVGLGWGVTGPATVAADPLNRAETYRVSVVVRAITLIPVLAAALPISALLAPRDGLLAALIAAASAVGGLSAGWYFVGAAEPRALLLLDTVPRAVGPITGCLLLWLGAPAIGYAIAVLGGYVMAVGASYCAIMRGGPTTEVRRAPAMKTVFESLLQQRWGLLTAVVATVYQAAPLLVVAALLPAAAPMYAMADKLMKLTLSGVQPLSQSLQGWVAADKRASIPHRARQGAAIALTGGLVAGSALAIAAPLLSVLLSNGRIHIGLEFGLPIGVTVLASLVSQTTGLASLAALGRDVDIAVSAVIGSVVGAVLLVVAAAFTWAVAVAWSVSIAEIVVCGYQVLALRRTFLSMKEVVS